MRIIAIIALIVFSACRSSKGKENAIATLGDHVLMASEVSSLMPKGLSTQDSVSFCNDYVEQWIKEKALIEESKSIDLPPDFEAKLEKYKSQLLIQALMESVVSNVNANNQNAISDSNWKGLPEEVLLENKKWRMWEQYQVELVAKYQSEGKITRP